MNVIQAVKMYITKMTEESGPGMKVILMDKETTSIISMVFSQSEILQKEVYLFERIDNLTKWDNLKHMKCIVFVRPTSENVALLSRELRQPKYGVYFVYFSNVISKSDVKTLAECDEQEAVREVHEVFADYLAVDRHLFSFNIVGCMHGRQWNQNHLQRCAQGLLAVLLSLKRRAVVRYDSSTEACARLAERVRELVRREAALAEAGAPAGPTTVLLVLDRMGDPVTPLLNQWTYQAMVHELLTINNNRVSLAHAQEVPKDFKEVVLSSEQDEFYAKNLYSNFGEIGQTMKLLMDEFQKKAKSHQKVETIDDMKNFVETYPLFKKMSGTVTRHVSVVGELSSLVARHALLDVSELEQEIACQSDHTKHLQRLKALLANESVRPHDLIKLVLLYALRYHTHAQATDALPGLLKTLQQRGCQDTKIVLLALELAAARSRNENLFRMMTPQNITKRLFKGLNGVENIYTQHTPLLKDTLEDLIKGKLRENLYPTLGGDDAGYARRPQDIIVFMVGGTTYEESLCVHQINQAFPGVRVVLGGTTIHNSTSFFEEVKAAMQGVHRTHTRHIKNV